MKDSKMALYTSVIKVLLSPSNNSNGSFFQISNFDPVWPVTSVTKLDFCQCTILSFLLAITTLSFPHGSPLRQGFLLLQITVTVQAYFAPAPSNMTNVAELYTYGLLLGNLTARYFDRLYLRVPEKTFHRLVDGEAEDPNKLPRLEKALWALELLITMRGIGWNWRVSGIPPSWNSSRRRQFLQACVLKYVTMYTGLYLISVGSQMILTDLQNVHNTALRGTLVAITSNNIFLTIYVPLGWAAVIYSHFGIYMLPLQALCVGLSVGPRAWQSPEAWPPNFGSISEAYRIRRFWGYVFRIPLPLKESFNDASYRITWHQQLRRVINTPGSLLLSLAPSLPSTKIRPTRLLKRYILHLSAFLFSTLIHMAGTHTVSRTTHLPALQGGEPTYYFLHAVVIIFEDFNYWLLTLDHDNKPPSARGRRILGYLVTATWYFYVQMRFRAIPLATALGIVDERRGPRFAALDLLGRNADAVPGNFIRVAAGAVAAGRRGWK